MAPVISDIIQRELKIADLYINSEKKILKQEGGILKPIKEKLKKALVWIPEGQDNHELIAEMAIDVFRTEMRAFGIPDIATFVKGSNKTTQFEYIQYELWRKMIAAEEMERVGNVSDGDKSMPSTGVSLI